MEEDEELTLKPCSECGGERNLTEFFAEEGIRFAWYNQSGFHIPRDRHDITALVCNECGLLTLYVDDVGKLVKSLTEQ
jgi:hypothetical protein